MIKKNKIYLTISYLTMNTHHKISFRLNGIAVSVYPVLYDSYYVRKNYDINWSIIITEHGNC